MTLKSIELQVALPRVTEAGNIQNQLSQKPAYDQSQIAQHNMKQAEQRLKRSNELDEASTLLVGEEDEKREKQGQQHSGNKGKQQGEEQERIEHPYKGRHIDLSL